MQALMKTFLWVLVLLLQLLHQKKKVDGQDFVILRQLLLNFMGARKKMSALIMMSLTMVSGRAQLEIEIKRKTK
jgi:hypothetical protein